MTATRSILSASLVAAVACGSPTSPATPRAAAPLTIDAIAAADSNVNAYVVSDGAGAIVIDATKNAADGATVAARVAARTTGPVTVLVTHGHPDHFLGLGAIRAALPAARFVVARPEIKDDVIGMATWMTEQGWLAQLPAMQPRTATHPDGFDYAGELEVVSDAALTLPGGARLELDTAYPATEAAHMTTAYSPDANALFTSDLAYHQVHLWLGIGVTRQSAAAWQEQLDALTARWRERAPTVYPGHGAPTDVGVFAADRAYIADLLEVTRSAASDEAAMAAMVSRYPEHANREFLLMMSVKNLRAQ